MLRDSNQLDQEVLREVQRQLDVEESLLDSVDPEFHVTEETPLLGSLGHECEHLARHWPDHDVPEPVVCERCLAEGTRWVHLRMCLACGNVACCDSSPARHAGAHYREESHPVMRSVEPGEAWRWCYVDERLG